MTAYCGRWNTGPHEMTPENSYTHNGVSRCKACRVTTRRRSRRKTSAEYKWLKELYENDASGIHPDRFSSDKYGR